MKKLFYTLIFLSFAFFSVSGKAANLNMRCKDFVTNPKVKIKAVFEPLRYDYSRASRTLENMHQKEYGGQTHEGYRINGLTPYNLNTTLEFNILKKVFKDGVTCFYPGEINLTFTLKDPVIYVARNIRRGTCEFNVTLRHEQTHEQINIEALEYYLPKIRDAFIAAVRKYAVAGREKDDISLEAVQSSLQKKYLDAINPLLSELENEIAVEQAKFDNLEQYNYESGLCHVVR